MLSALLTLFVIGILGFVAVTVILALLGVFFGLAFGAVALLFKALPILLIGWVAVKLIRRGESRYRRQITPADQRWLDS
ncbi:MAG TPA: hypothetical protein VHG28_11505 [Longimicrobiaceae bacterium]|nr:hypothetical protein [Longimicrobiaceae bacterium]